MELDRLKSGSDIRGVALSGYGEEVDLTEEAVEKLSAAFLVWLKKRSDGLKIAVGMDSRLSGKAIKNTVINTLVKDGATVLDCGMCSTPAMFMMTKFAQTNADASIMVTASHHPVQKNGLKFFTKLGGLSGGDISEIIELAKKGEKLSENGGKVTGGDFLKLYCDFLINKVRTATGEDKPLKGFKIVVDAGNGAGGFYAGDVLEPLGADISGSQFLEPDGHFPNHIPNPENETAMRSVADCAVKNNADLGVIFDTDVDRAAVVTGDGCEINKNRLIALISKILLGENPGATIVTDSVTSDGLKEFIEKSGGKHHRFKRGYRNVIDEAIRLNSQGTDAPLAIETSGHAALRENYFLDDGAYLVTRLIIKMAQLKKSGRSLISLISGLKMPVEELEIRIGYKVSDWKPLGALVIDTLKKVKDKKLICAPDNYEGVRFSVPSACGWFLIRQSVHDPVIPINIASDCKGGAYKIALIVKAYLEPFSGLDLSNLNKLFK